MSKKVILLGLFMVAFLVACSSAMAAGDPNVYLGPPILAPKEADDVVPVTPEPASLLLLGLGSGAMAFTRRRQLMNKGI